MNTFRTCLLLGGALAAAASLWQCGDNGGTGNPTSDLSMSSSDLSGDMAGTNNPPPDLTGASPAPTITSISPALGPNAGGTAITINGTGFLQGATVKVSGAACTVTNLTATSITCTTPANAGTCGPIGTSVINPDTQLATSTAFSYQSAGAQAFAAVKTIANGASNGRAVWADFNNDGYNDIANLNAAAAISVNVQQGNGNATFNAGTVGYAGVAGQVPTALAVGDLDNNGYADLVAIINGKGNGNTATAAPSVLVLLGQNNGTFKAAAGGPVNLTANSAPTALAVASADSKTKPYVVVVGTTGAKASLDVLTNDGTGMLSLQTQQVFGAAGTSGDDLALADINKDGKLDAIVANTTGNALNVLAGNGAGVFTSVQNSPFAMGTGPTNVIAVDLNRDGNLDLVSANTGGGGGSATCGLNVRQGDGMGGFGAPVFQIINQVPTGLAAADFNVDGNPDIVVAHFSAVLFSYFQGKGTIAAGATFAAVVTNNVGGGANSILAAPFNTANKDHLPDVVTTSSLNNLYILKSVCQ